MNNLETAYRKHMASLDGKGRVARSLSLFADITTMIEKKIQREQPNLMGQPLRREVARHLYRSDRNIQSMLDRR